MGVIRALARLARLGIVAGIALLGLTLAGVGAATMHARSAHLGGRGIEAPLDAVIVLGAAVRPDGVLAYDSRRRAAAAAEMVRSGRARHAIFSGGVSPSRTVSDGAMMRDHAIALGAPAERLLVEGRSISTFENIRFSFAIAEREGFARLGLVSDPYHLPRAQALAAYFGRPGIALVAADGFHTIWWPHRMVTLTREALAWWLNLAKVAGWEALAALGVGEDRRGELVR